MDRLTRKTKTGNYTSADCTVSIRQVYDKMGAYEDAEEKGLLLKLPCKVGDTLYSTLEGKVIKLEVSSVKYHCEAENHGVFIRERIIIETDDIVTEIDFSYIGKSVFLTQEEAEQTLAQSKKMRL